jgi:hypothetical protein
MAHLYKMWWLIGRRCDGSPAEDVATHWYEMW